VVQETAKRACACAYYLLDEEALAAVVGDRPVAEMVAAAGAARERVSALPFEAPRGTIAAIRVVASITHTIGGLRVDAQARVLDGGGLPISGLFAAGVDVGGVATGGYSSGLAQAAVLGLVAAETAVAA
jgi:predicted oxidoreductase